MRPPLISILLSINKSIVSLDLCKKQKQKNKLKKKKKKNYKQNKKDVITNFPPHPKRLLYVVSYTIVGCVLG